MTETARIQSLFEKLYNGSPWLDISITQVLKNITAAQAATHSLPGCNSIWEITNHMIAWRRNVLQRVQGEVPVTPDDNYVEPVTNTSAKAWNATLKDFDDTQKNWLHVLKSFSATTFEKVYPPNNMTYYEHIQGIIQHDAYHLGQIVLLAKAAR